MSSKIWHHATPGVQQLNEFLVHDAAGHMGLEFTDAGSDYLAARLPLSPKTKQAFGLLHGGVSCVVSEVMGSIAANLVLDRSRQYAVGIEINATHVNSASGEGFVYARVVPLRVGSSLQSWETRISDEQGKLLCISRLTTMTRDTR